MYTGDGHPFQTSVISPFVSRLCIGFYGYERHAGPTEVLLRKFCYFVLDWFN